MKRDRNRRSDRSVRLFSSFKEAERADREDYARLTPDERVAMMELCAEGPQRYRNGRSPRFRRVWRLLERE